MRGRASDCSPEGKIMLFDYVLGAAAAVFILAYLTYALVRPERF